jgi:hypothetical protein
MTVTTTDHPTATLELVGDALPTGLEALRSWVEALEITRRGVELIIDTPFIPASFWPLPKALQLKDFPVPSMRHPQEKDEEYAQRRAGAIASTTTAITVGAELGLGPNAAMKYLYVTRGRPQIYAEGILALFHAKGHRSRPVARDVDRCAVAVALRGSAEWTEFEFTIDDAERAGYVKANPKYTSDPKAMLWARVISIAVRSVAPEVLGGIAGEADVVDVIEGEVISSSPARVTVEDLAARATAPAPAAETPAEAPAGEPAAPAEPARIDERTWKLMNAEWVRLGVVGEGMKDRRLRGISRIVGRTIESGSELLVAEGDVALDTLRSISADDPDRILDVLGELEARPAEPAAPAGEPAGWDTPPPADDAR